MRPKNTELSVGVRDRGGREWEPMYTWERAVGTVHLDGVQVTWPRGPPREEAAAVS